MEWLLSWLKPIDAPGSIGFLWLSVGIGLFVMFVWPRNRRLGRRWLAGVAALYVVLALPIVAWAIATTLPHTSTTPAAQVGPLDALVVFDGDNRRGRVTTAADVFARSKPATVWVLGLQADWIQDELRASGLPWDVVQIDTATGTTRAQMQWVADRRSRDPHLRMAVIASRLQAPRMVGLARSAGLDVPIVRAPVDREPPTDGVRLAVPTYLALRVSRDALYEHAAVRYYAWKGWIAP